MNILLSKTLDFLAGGKLNRNLRDPLNLLFLFKRRDVAVLHCGAWHGEESAQYLALGAVGQYWVEAQPDACLYLRNKFGEEFVFEGALSDLPNQKVSFQITDNLLSSSLLEIDESNDWKVRKAGTISVVTITIDEVMDKIAKLNSPIPNLLVVDVQGSELDVLKGMIDSTHNFDYVICEVTDKPFYNQGASSNEVVDYLCNLGFKVIWKFTKGTHGHGDVLFMKNPNLFQFYIYKALMIMRNRMIR